MASTSYSDKQPDTDVETQRTRLCDEFATITGTDSAVAQCYLAENDWEMQVQRHASCREPLFIISTAGARAAVAR